jgi:hypothetical protein
MLLEKAGSHAALKKDLQPLPFKTTDSILHEGDHV